MSPGVTFRDIWRIFFRAKWRKIVLKPAKRTLVLCTAKVRFEPILKHAAAPHLAGAERRPWQSRPIAAVRARSEHLLSPRVSRHSVEVQKMTRLRPSRPHAAEALANPRRMRSMQNVLGRCGCRSGWKLPACPDCCLDQFAQAKQPLSWPNE